MDKLIVALTNLLKRKLSESYYRVNTRDKVIYPYLTFTLSGEPLRTHANGFYVDVDLFDNNGNDDERMETVVFELMQEFANYHQSYRDFLLQIEFRQSTLIPTGSDTLQRRNMQFYCKIDWRKN